MSLHEEHDDAVSAYLVVPEASALSDKRLKPAIDAAMPTSWHKWRLESQAHDMCASTRK